MKLQWPTKTTLVLAFAVLAINGTCNGQEKAETFSVDMGQRSQFCEFWQLEECANANTASLTLLQRVEGQLHDRRSNPVDLLSDGELERLLIAAADEISKIAPTETWRVAGVQALLDDMRAFRELTPADQERVKESLACLTSMPGVTEGQTPNVNVLLNEIDAYEKESGEAIDELSTLLGQNCRAVVLLADRRAAYFVFHGKRDTAIRQWLANRERKIRLAGEAFADADFFMNMVIVDTMIKAGKGNEAIDFLEPIIARSLHTLPACTVHPSFASQVMVVCYLLEERGDAKSAVQLCEQVLHESLRHSIKGAKRPAVDARFVLLSFLWNQKRREGKHEDLIEIAGQVAEQSSLLEGEENPYEESSRKMYEDILAMSEAANQDDVREAVLPRLKPL